MKKQYPDYRKKGMNHIRETLPQPIKKIIEEYLNFVKATAGPEKLKQYEMFMLQFYDVIEKPLNKLTKKDCEEFWGILNHSERAIPTKNLIRLIVKRFLKWKYQDLRMIENLKMQKHLVDRNKINKANHLKPYEIELLLRNAGNYRNKAIISLLKETAARPEEVRLLKWSKIDFQNKTITLYSNKTCRSRTLPISKSIKWLLAWRDDFQFSEVCDTDFVFVSPIREQPLSRSFFTNLIKRLGKKAGITRSITPYMFRHTTLQEIYEKGVGDLIHRQFAGHSTDSKMTSVYVEMDDKKMQNAVRGIYEVQLTIEQKNKYETEIELLKQRLLKLEYEQHSYLIPK